MAVLVPSPLAMIALQLRIEEYLLARPRWVPISELVEVFGVKERALRATGRRRPLMAHCAISSDAPGAHGLKHLRHATKEERLKYKHAKLRNLIAYARALKDYHAAIEHCLSGKFRTQFDANDQGVLPV